MLKKALFFSFFLLTLSLVGVAQEYVVRYQHLSSGSIFHIETIGGVQVAKVLRELKDQRIVYSYLNTNDELMATGQLEKHEMQTSIHVHDVRGEEIGWFSAEIQNLYPTEYRVFSSANALIARGWMNWLGSTFALVDPNHTTHYFVTYSRPMFMLFNDHWHFDIHEEEIIDLRLLAIIGVFQTSCDLKFEKFGY